MAKIDRLTIYIYKIGIHGNFLEKEKNKNISLLARINSTSIKTKNKYTLKYIYLNIKILSLCCNFNSIKNTEYINFIEFINIGRIVEEKKQKKNTIKMF